MGGGGGGGGRGCEILGRVLLCRSELKLPEKNAFSLKRL